MKPFDPKEKARELIAKYMELTGQHDRQITNEPNPTMAYRHAKQCALIAVGILIRAQPSIVTWKVGNEEIKHLSGHQYWKQVEQEIKKL